MSTDYRVFYNPTQNAILPNVNGTALAGGAGIGINFGILPGLLGIKVELNGVQRKLKADTMSGERLGTGELAIGLLVQMDSIPWPPPAYRGAQR